MPLRARQIFGAKLVALVVVATAAMVTLNLFPSLMFPAVSASRWALDSIGRRPAGGACGGVGRGLLFSLFRTGGAAGGAVESAAAAAVRAGDGIPARSARGDDADSAGAELFDSGDGHQPGGASGVGALAAAGLVRGTASGDDRRPGSGDAGVGAARDRGPRDRGGAGAVELRGELPAASRAAGGRRGARREDNGRGRA